MDFSCILFFIIKKNESFNEVPEVNTVIVTFEHLPHFYSKKNLF